MENDTAYPLTQDTDLKKESKINKKKWVTIIISVTVAALFIGMVYVILKPKPKSKFKQNPLPQKITGDVPTVTLNGKEYKAVFLKITPLVTPEVSTNNEALTAFENRLATGQKFSYQDYLDLGYLYRANKQAKNALTAYEKAKTLLKPSDPAYQTKLKELTQTIEDTKAEL